MSIRINTEYGQAITSEMLNEKIDFLSGGNVKINGFDILLVDSNIIVRPGKCIIRGAIIEKTDNSKVDTENLYGEVFVFIKYFHFEKNIKFITKDIDFMEDDELLIGSINLSTSERKGTNDLLSIKKLSKAYKALKNNLLSNQELIFEGEDILISGSIAGITRELSLSGNTISNIIDIEDKTRVFANIKASGDNINIPNSKDGYINNFSFKGRTLVNLYNQENTELIATQLTTRKLNYSFKRNTTYTVFVDLKDDIEVNVQDSYKYFRIDDINSETDTNILNGITGKVGLKYKRFCFTFRPISSNPSLVLQQRMVIGERQSAKNIVILEGDYSNIEIPYFSGIKSVGNFENIESKTYKNNSLKIFDKKTYIKTDNIQAVIDIDSKYYEKEILIKPDTNYRLNLISHINGDLNIELFNLRFTLNNENPFIVFRTPIDLPERNYIRFNGFGEIEKVMITEQVNSPTEYVNNYESVCQNGSINIYSSSINDNTLNNIEHKLIINVTEPLKSIPNGKYDTIEFVDDSWVLIKRIDEFDFSEDGWVVNICDDLSTETHLYFYINNNYLLSNNGNKIHTDKYYFSRLNHGNPLTSQTECAIVSTHLDIPCIGFKLLKSRFSEINSKEIINFLTSYGIKVLVERNEDYYEKVPLNKTINLQTFNEFTRIFSDSNIKSKIKAKIPTNLGAVVKQNIERISNIEDTIDRVLLPTLVNTDFHKTLLEIDYNIKN